MSTRLIVLSLAVLLIAGGCASGNKTPYHKQVRTEAAHRVNVVNAQLNYDQAKQCFDVGQFDRATKQIEAAIKLYPENADYYLLLGRIYLETHRLEKSAEAFNVALEKKAEFAEPHYFLGVVYQRWSDDEKACKEYLAAYELATSNVQYLLAATECMISMKQLEQARTLMTSKLAYFEHNSAMRQLLGQIALLEGDAAGAAKLYSEARMLDPDDSMLLEELASAQYAAGQYRSSYDSLKQLQKKLTEPRSDLMHLEARCLVFMERTIEARNLYLELTRVEPTNPVAWIELGTVAWEMKDYIRVGQCAGRVLALAPERHEGYLLKAIVERERGNSTQAMDLLRESARRAPDAALPSMLLGQLLEDSGDRHGAIAAYAGALRADPENSEARALFARLSDKDVMLTTQNPQRIAPE